jgi:hypothetical protein
VVFSIVILLIDVVALIRAAGKAVTIIRAAGKAVVACGHEVAHGTGITKSGEIPTDVGVVLFLGTRGSGG